MSSVLTRSERAVLATATTTAEDTLKRKTRDAGVASGGHFVPGIMAQTMYK